VAEKAIGQVGPPLNPTVGGVLRKKYDSTLSGLFSQAIVVM
jgi:hypothetical protein